MWVWLLVTGAGEDDQTLCGAPGDLKPFLISALLTVKVVSFFLVVVGRVCTIMLRGCTVDEFT